MKFFIALFALVAVAQCRPQYHISQNVVDMIRDYGYPVQNYTVQTQDGYLLDLIRIPGGYDYKQTFETLEQQQQGGVVQTDKPVVFLMHGLLSTSEDFVIGGPTEGLAFFLAEHGYDVFLGNARGTYYGRKHTTLNPDKDAAFWKFCWNQIGERDLPALIDEVLRVSGKDKLSYIGHMQGTTVFYVMASLRPEYNQYIERMISLGPMAYMKNADNEMYKTIAEHIYSKPWLMKNMGVNEFHPSNEFMTVAGQETCIARGVNERICQNPFFLINGYGSDNMNMTTVERYAQRVPAGASTRQVLHYAQLFKSGRFEKFIDRYNQQQQQEQPGQYQQQQQQQQQDQQQQVEEYPLEKITCPMYFVYSNKDLISTQENIDLLKGKLNNVVRDINVSQCNNNLDLLFSKYVKQVYNIVREMLEK